MDTMTCIILIILFATSAFFIYNKSNNEYFDKIRANIVYADAPIQTSPIKIQDDFNRMVYHNDPTSVPYDINNKDKPNEMNENSKPETVAKQNTNFKCQNASLNAIYATGDNTTRNTYTCKQSNSNIDFNGEHDANGIDPSDYYKKLYTPPKMYLEDERYGGWNYTNFEYNGSPTDIGYIPLYSTNNYPVGINFTL